MPTGGKAPTPPPKESAAMDISSDTDAQPAAKTPGGEGYLEDTHVHVTYTNKVDLPQLKRNPDSSCPHACGCVD
jgi:hypothetical protein